MFIKKIVKDDKTYYLLTLCEKVEKGKGKGKEKDTLFNSYFIPEKLALMLIKLDIPVVDKESK